VEVIRRAENATSARSVLETRFGLSSAQSDAILSMQLRRLTALERGSLEAEGEKLRASSAELRELLGDRSKVLGLISDELGELKEKYGTPRRTQIGSAAEAELDEIDMVANAPCIIIRSFKGYMKRLPLDVFEAQQRGTRGKAGISNLHDDDAVVQIINCHTHDTILCLSDAGVAYAIGAYRVPETSRTSRGALAQQLLPISSDEVLATVLPVADFSEDRYLLLNTAHGWIKKTPLKAFERITARGLIAVSLGEGDTLVRASLCSLSDSVILCSGAGLAVRFDTDEAQLRASGRQSRGVKSMRMGEGDTIADMFVVPSGGQGAAADGEASLETNLVAVTRNGFGKRVPVDQFRRQRRGGKGVIAMKFKKADDRLLALSPGTDDEELLLITQKGTIVRQLLSRISEQGRAATGVKLQRLDSNDLVASAVIVPKTEESDDDADEHGSEGDGD
jgi:DNA gyrase subunit A